MAEANSIQIGPDLFGQETILHGQTCTKCRKRKPFPEFGFNKIYNRRQSWCRKCMQETAQKRRKTPQGRAWRKKHEALERNVLKKKNIQLRLMFGITLKHYEGMLANQDGVCAICRKKETVIDKRTGKPLALSVDHCHATGKIRGLLCGKCNLAIGAFKDDLAIVRAAAAYLESWR